MVSLAGVGFGACFDVDVDPHWALAVSEIRGLFGYLGSLRMWACVAGQSGVPHLGLGANRAAQKLKLLNDLAQMQ